MKFWINNIDLIIRLKFEENTFWIRELIDTVNQEYSITYAQAKDLMDVLDEDDKIYAWTSLFNRIVNRHFRKDLLQSLHNVEAKSSVKEYLGEAYNFNYYNPTGHYKLRLSNKAEREVALTLLMLNRKYSQLVKEGILSDRSKLGNKSCFRNEFLIFKSFNPYTTPSMISNDIDTDSGESKNRTPINIWDGFILPKYGILEWDFIYLVDPPIKDEETSEEKQDLIKNLLLEIEGKIDLQILLFKSISEYLVLSSEQLSDFIELIDDPNWKTECYMAGVSRIYDTREYDFIKKKWKFPETSKEIYHRFGIFNLFSPYKCTGSYRLDLSIYEERMVCKILMELAKAEGFQYMTNVILDGTPFEEIDKDFVDKLAETGILECSYVTPEEAADNECREKMGIKYLGWTPKHV